jgi:hypothetical protein
MMTTHHDTMNNLRNAERLHDKLRRHLYAFANDYPVTCIEAVGVLHHLADEVSTADLVRDGLLAPGDDWDEGELTA